MFVGVIFWFERDSISETNPLYKYFPIYKRCDCLPSCTTLQYTAEISQNDLYWSESKFNSNLESVNSSDKWYRYSSQSDIKQIETLHSYYLQVGSVRTQNILQGHALYFTASE